MHRVIHSINSASHNYKYVENAKPFDEYSDYLPEQYSRLLYKFISFKKRIGMTFVV